MKHIKQKSYRDFYERNQRSGAIIIDVILDQYEEFFHEWDNAKNRKRDVHPELEKFLMECSDQIPLKESLEIKVHISEEPRQEGREEELKATYDNYVLMLLLTQYESLRNLRWSVVKNLVSGFFMLVLSALLKMQLWTGLLPKILIEGVSIGGWVFIWQAVSTLAYGMSANRQTLRKQKRLQDAPLAFTYQS